MQKEHYGSVAEWTAEGVRLFGENQMLWKFVCPSCGHVASVQEWKDVGASERHVAFSCVGRWMETKIALFGKPGPCDYAGGGLFRLNPVHIVGREDNVFQFAQ